MTLTRSLERAIEGGLLFILAGTPLAFGSAPSVIHLAVQMLVFFIFFLYGIRQCLIDSSSPPGFSPYSFRSFFLRYPFVIPFLLWIGWGLVQMIPLPLAGIRVVSPQAHEIYFTILGGGSGGGHPLSLSSFDTALASQEAVTCGLLFYLVGTYSRFPSASNLPKTPTPDPFFNVLLLTIAVTVGFQAFYGLWEYFTDPQQQIFFFPRSIAVKGAAGTFTNPNHFANYLVLFFPLLFSWMILPKEGRSFCGRGILLATVLSGMAAAVVASHSLMAIFVGAVAVLLLGLSLLWLRASQKSLVLLLGLLGLGGLFLVFIDPGFASFQRQLHPLFPDYSTSRLRVWKDSFRIIQDFPWTGTGLGTFQFIFPKYSSVPVLPRFHHAHNDWLELLVETGILGSGLMATAIVLFFVTYGKHLPRLHPGIRPLGFGVLISLVSFMIHSVAEFNFYIPANAYSFTIVLGMGLRLNEMAKHEP